MKDLGGFMACQAVDPKEETCSPPHGTACFLFLKLEFVEKSVPVQIDVKCKWLPMLKF